MNARTNRITLYLALLLLSMTGSARALHAHAAAPAPPEQCWNWALKPSEILGWIADMTDRFWRQSGARIEGNGMPDLPGESEPHGPSEPGAASSRPRF